MIKQLRYALCIVLFLVGCGDMEEYVTYHEMFGGDVRVTRTEVVEHGFHDYTLSVDLDVEINAPGNYMFEGREASQVNFSVDTMKKKWEFNVDKVPYFEKIQLHFPLHRFEAYRVIDNTIQRDSERFYHKGYIRITHRKSKTKHL